MSRHTGDVRKVRPNPAAKGSSPKPARRWWPDLGICLLLVVSTLAVYSQVRHYDFVNYDDPQYVGENVHVRAGLTSGGVAWALKSYDAANWFPLTWLSHTAASSFLGMISNPMVGTLPFVLLLLDAWPLKRALWPWNWLSAKALLFEKLPLFAMAAAASALTFLAQRQGGAVAPLAGIPLAFRLENAVVSYVAYIRDMFWPAGLAVLYPYPRALAIPAVAAAGLALAGISILVARQARARPYLAVGWCWYLGTLAPVIGLVQVGTQARADRYTYVPTIGLFLMLGWGAAELVQRVPRARNAVIAAAVLACSACLVVTWFQIQYWASSETLLRHALEVTSDNFITHHNLADYYLQQNRNEEARQEDAEAVRIEPMYPEARLNLGSMR